MKLPIILILSVAIVALLAGVGSAVECNADLSQGGEICTVSNSLTLNGTYNLNRNGTVNGYINITGSNIIFDCNSTTLRGNGTSALVGVFDSVFDNVTIRNCNIVGYSIGIEFFNAANSGTIANNTVINSTDRGIHLRLSSLNIVENNTIIKPSNTGIDIENSGDNNLTNNNVTGANVYAFWIRSASTNRNRIINTFTSNSTNSIAFQASGQNNTIDNLISYKDQIGIRYISNSQGNTIINSFFNLSELSYGIKNDAAINNITIRNVSFHGKPITQTNDGYAIYDVLGSSNISIIDSYFQDFGELRVYLAKDIIIKNTTVKRLTYFSDFENSTNVTIINSRFESADKIGFENSANVLFFNNTIYNMTNNKDGWLAGISLNNITNFNVSFNNFSYIGQIGIMVRQSRIGYIMNNSIDLMPQSAKVGLLNQVNEVDMCIGILEVYKKYTNGMGSAYLQYSEISKHYSDNITVLGNTYGDNCQVMLRTQGTTNLTHDTSNYKYFSWQLPFFIDRDDYYIQNRYTFLSNVNQSLIISNYLRQGYWLFNTQVIRYQHFDAYDYFLNENATLSFDIMINNRTQSLSYFSNGSICGSPVLSSNTGNLNCTLQPGNYTYVLDNFNVTYLVDRPNSPITTSGSGKNIVFTSTLSTTVTSPAYISGSIPCNEIQGIALDGVSQSYTCDTDTDLLSFSGLSIDSGDNNLVITTGVEGSGDICEGFSNGVSGLGYIFIFIFAVIGIVGVAGIIAYYSGVFDGFSMSGIGDMGSIEWDNLIYIALAMGGLLFVLICSIIVIWVPCSLTG